MSAPIPEPARLDAGTPFHDLEKYIALPRITGLTMAPDGSRLVLSVSAPNPQRTRHLTALWEVDPAGERSARRLTRGAKGESAPAFLPDGSLLFVSARPDAEATTDTAGSDDEPPAALWLLPAGGGEARIVGTRPGGIDGVVVARESGTIVAGSPTLPASGGGDDDAKRRAARKERKVTAILHESYPVRYWDSDLGPARRRLLVADPSGLDAVVDELPAEPDTTEPRLDLHDLTGHVGRAIGADSTWDVTPDGATVVVSWITAEAFGSERYALVAIGTADGARRVLLDDPDYEYAAPVVSPDGRSVALHVYRRAADGEAQDLRIGLLDLSTGGMREVASGWDRWPATPACWTPDGSAIVVAADEQGTSPAFRIDLDADQDPAGDRVTRLTGDHGAYTDIRVSPDGATVYALRAAVDATPAPVRLDATSALQQPVRLRGPITEPALPGRLDAVETTALDGTPLRAWLVLPASAGPADRVPLLVWIHGGPLGSWNSWSWRWNPWLAAARGYAVLLPDPALSTGYGLSFVARGWSRWGSAPYEDLMRLTDAAEARDDIDETRTAAMGGSFGGYMANWVAGHTDRFRGIVSHASLWALDQFGPTTDAYYYWRREMTDAMTAENSPHLFADRITTPMLIIHGDKDYRVPIGEALRLWAELAARSGAPDGTMPHKFLYFPDENHWVLTPQHAKIWYETVFAFLAHTVHGEPWVTPALLE